MRFAYDLTGATPHVKKYQVAADALTAGVPKLIPVTTAAGVAVATTTTATDMVGVSLDTATYVTAQQTDGTSTERMVSLIINPHAVWAMLMSQGATLGTALTLRAITTASSDGLTLTTGESWASPQYIDGVAWAYDGANVGQARRISTSSGTAATVLNAFDSDTVVGDNFIRAPYWPAASRAIQLTTNLDGADASIVVNTGAEFKCIELALGNQTNGGRTDSWVYAIAGDHVWGPRPT